MSVTLTIADLKQPAGELSEELFPNGNLDTLLAGWLNQAQVKVEADSGIGASNQNVAAAAWVYHRAYNYKASLQANVANQVSFSNQPGISKTMSSDQREFFVNRASYWLDIYKAYDMTPVTPVATNTFIGSVSVSVVPQW